MENIQIQVADKVATVIGAPCIICGNSDYTITFTFDGEWDNYEAKTARFTYVIDGEKKYKEVPFTGNSCNAPILTNINLVNIGVYAGDLCTTTAARVNCRKSILCGDPTHEPPTPDVYNEIMALLESGKVKGTGILGIVFDREDADGNYIYVVNYTDFTSNEITVPRGQQGISIVSVTIRDNHLIITLSNEEEIDAGAITEKLIADEPKTIGQKNCLARAAQFRDIKVTPTGSLPLVGAPATTNEFTGIPYSSVRDTDLFIGCAVSLDTYMTAIHNPNSVLYTNQSSQVLAASWYGLNCSAYVSYCYDLPYIRTTQTFGSAIFMTPIADSSDIQLCDCCNDNVETGHIVLITGIERDIQGTIKYVTISECYPAFTKQTRLTFDEFNAKYNNGKYIIYRNTRLEYVTEADASKWIGDGVVTRVDYEYSDLCTNLGDKACIATDDTIILQPLNTEGYVGITLYKDGEEYEIYSVENVTLTNLPAGMYEAKLTPDRGIGSVSFEVLEVGTTKQGNRYTFTKGTPLSVVFKLPTYYTLKYVELTNVDRRNGYKDIITTDIASQCAYFCVAYKGKYGIVVKRYNFEDTPVPSDIPDEYQKVEYIQSSGTQYIDTGVVGTNTTNCDVTAVYMEYITGMANQNIFGVQNNGYRRWIGLSTKVGTGYGTNSAVDIGSEQSSYRANKKCVFSMHDNVYSVTCESDTSLNAEHTYTAAEFTTEANCMLFASMLNGSTLRPAAARIYSAKIYNETTLVRDFVPCYRKEDGVIGMYDKVTETFYTNAGTGTFAKGSNV